MFDLLLSLGIPKQYVGDVWVFILLVVTSLFLVVIFKKQNLGAVIAAVYGAYAIETKVFFTWFEGSTMRFAFLLLAALILFFVFKKFFGEVATGSNIASEWIKISLVSVSIVGLTASIVMDWYAKSTLSSFFSPFSMSVFRSNEGQLLWMVVPVLVIYLLNLRR